MKKFALSFYKNILFFIIINIDFIYLFTTPPITSNGKTEIFKVLTLRIITESRTEFLNIKFKKFIIEYI